MKYLITFGYDGSKFHGFQRQKNMRNVQGTIENVLSLYLEETIVIKGAGRTDAKVHACEQAAHFETEKEIDFNVLKDLLQKENIDLKYMKIVDDNFHARYSAKKKIYCYKINLGKFDSRLIGYMYQPRFKIDINRIKEAQNIFIGVHDFRNFVSGYRDNYITCISKIEIKLENDILILTFEGTAFYRYMVRNIVGALIDLGKGKVSVMDLKKMLDNYEIPKQLSTAIADGLYLLKVEY